MTVVNLFTKYRAEILLAAILILSGVLNIWNIWNQGFSNEYYAAAVKSMMENPTLTFFNSFDAGGFVTVDKPPVGLWIQIACAALFGFSGWILALPQALAGIGSVALVYLIVSRPFGKPAGLVSSLALAITPIFTAVSRNETQDGLMIFIILMAVWVVLKAARERSLPYLLLSVILVGIGFNIKMIQAFVVLPAIVAVYLLGTGTPSKKQVLHLALAAMVLVIVSLSWVVAMDMIPADQRPYIGGSGDNTVFGLMTVHNGMERLESSMTTQGGNTGMTMPGVGMLPGARGGGPLVPVNVENATGDRRGVPMAAGDRMALQVPGQMPAMNDGQPGGPGSAPPGGMMGETGSPGLLRLFSSGLAAQISWLLAFAFAGLLVWWRRPASLSLKEIEDAGFSSERSLTLLAMGLWLLPGLLYFSFTSGFWHTYYLATIAPPLAALVGIGAVAMHEAYCTEGWKSWLLVAAVPVTGLIQGMILSYTAAWSGVLIPIVLAGTLIVTLVLVHLKIRRLTGTGHVAKAVVVTGIALLFVSPFVWSCTPMVYGESGLPVAGPQNAQDNGNTGMGMETGGGAFGLQNGTSKLAEYLTTHRVNETWIVAVPSAMNGASLILETGDPVMALGGFSGTDQILSVEKLRELIQDGKVRYFLISSVTGDGDGSSGNSGIFTWVQSTCMAVPVMEYRNNSSSSQGTVSAGLPGYASTGTGLPAGYGNGMSGPSDGDGGLPGSVGGQDILYDCAGKAGMT